MAEVMTPLIEVAEGRTFRNTTGDTVFVVAENHTLRDILRHLLAETDWEELIYLIKDISND